MGYAKSGLMPTDQTPSAGDMAKTQNAGARPLPPEAERALAEAAARRAETDGEKAQTPKEVAGRGGLDPARYGDWEINGLASDF
jgi:hypothetical protein